MASKVALFSSLVFFAAHLQGTTLTVDGGFDLRGALDFINQNPGAYEVVFNLPMGEQIIQLDRALPIVNLHAANSIVFDGTNNGHQIVIDGGGKHRGFFVRQGGVAFRNMTVRNVMATGGDGGDGLVGGGGGLGAGGGLFVDQAVVTLSGVNFRACLALGGCGGVHIPHTTALGGGGGMGGKGGIGLSSDGSSGGGGGGLTEEGGFCGLSGGGNGGGSRCSEGNEGCGGRTGMAAGSNGEQGSYGQGGGGGGEAKEGRMAGFGGDGGFGGGGGGSGFAQMNSSSNRGGGSLFGGGGGGGTPGGDGGFGGGGGAGGGVMGFQGKGGIGGGDGGILWFNPEGGGGAGFGGAIFVNKGGSLIIEGALSTGGNAVSAGSGFVNGAAAGSDLFGLSDAILNFAPRENEKVIVTGSIADDSAVSLPGPDYHVGEGKGLTLKKSGAGHLILQGMSTYSGPTIVSGGRLSIDGSIASNVIVERGAILSGAGLAEGSVAVEKGGALSPGHFTVGSLQLDPESVTNIEITPASSSLLIVNEQASLSGSALHVIQNRGDYGTSGSYEILTAGVISGAFDPIVQGGLPGFRFDLEQVGNNLFLLFQRSAYLIPTDGLKGNRRTLAEYLNESVPLSSVNYDLSQLSSEELNGALDAISPARNAFGTFASQHTMFSIGNAIASHLRDQRFWFMMNCEALCATFCSPESCTLWASAFGDFFHQREEEQNPAFAFQTAGAIAALETYGQGQAAGLIGLGGGTTYTHLHAMKEAGRSETMLYFASLYGMGAISNFYAEFFLIGSRFQIHNHRHIAFADVSASATIQGWQLAPHFGCGYAFHLCWGDIEPFAALDGAVNWEEDFHEHGAGYFDMRVTGKTSSMLRSQFGFHFYEGLDFRWGSLLLQEKAAYVNIQPFGTGDVTAAIASSSDFFTVHALSETQNLGSAGLEALLKIGATRAAFLGLSIESEFGIHFVTYEALVKAGKDF